MIHLHTDCNIYFIWYVLLKCTKIKLKNMSIETNSSFKCLVFPGNLILRLELPCQLDGLTFLRNSEYIEKREFVFAQPKTSC